MVYLREISESLILGDAKSVEELTEVALKEGRLSSEILNGALIPAMNEVGRKFSEGEFFLPEVLVASRAMYAGLNILRPLLAKSGTQPLGTIILATVRGDIHDIGKNLVGMMMEGAGFHVIDLGVDVSPDIIVSTVKEKEPLILGMSAMLTTTMMQMKVTINALKEEGLRDKVKVMIGGAPVTQRYADEIGANTYAEDAPVAVMEAKKLVGRK